MNINSLLDKMWSDYCNLSPKAQLIHNLLEKRGDPVLNDHIALRTFNHPKLGLATLANVFEKNGYKAMGEYFFKEKKLYAKHWEHADLSLPKIFISELEVEKMSPLVQQEIEKMVAQIPEGLTAREDFSMCGRPWKMSFETYEALAKESEYASWVAAFGFRPNHFTVNINALKSFKDIQTLNEFIQSNGFKLNASGGEIKGTPEELLEQSSTMAESVNVEFSDGTHMIPSCYYEFAKRYVLPNGKLYQGFIAKSADKIFESTNRS